MTTDDSTALHPLAPVPAANYRCHHNACPSTCPPWLQVNIFLAPVRVGRRNFYRDRARAWVVAARVPVRVRPRLFQLTRGGTERLDLIRAGHALGRVPAV